jgi:hypothetical protein
MRTLIGSSFWQIGVTANSLRKRKDLCGSSWLTRNARRAGFVRLSRLLFAELSEKTARYCRLSLKRCPALPTVFCPRPRSGLKENSPTL